MRTTVLLDVDGVISAEAPTYWPHDTWVERTLTMASHNDAPRVLWSTALIDGLREIAALPGVEMVWLTTWARRAPEVLAPAIGIGLDWRYINRDDAVLAAPLPDLDWWKADAARDALTSADRVVWIDDHISLWMDMLREAGPHGRLDWMDPARILAVCPDGRRGMDHSHLTDVTRFILTGERPPA